MGGGGGGGRQLFFIFKKPQTRAGLPGKLGRPRTQAGSQHAGPSTALTCQLRHLQLEDQTHPVGDLLRGGPDDGFPGVGAASWRWGLRARASQGGLGVAQLGCPRLMHGARLPTHRCMACRGGVGGGGSGGGGGGGDCWLLHRLNAAVKLVVNRVTLLSLRMRLRYGGLCCND